MARIRHLEKAPITEALVDFRAAIPPDFAIDSLKSLRNTIGDRYPVVEEMRFVKAEFELSKGLPERKDTDFGIRGYLFKGQDGQDVAQFRADGFTYNRLQPYTSWDAVLPEALGLWELFVQTVVPVSITRSRSGISPHAD